MESNDYQPSDEYAATVADNLSSILSGDDLVLLCFDLGIDEELVWADTDPTALKATKFVWYCVVHNLLADLVKVCTRLWPDHKWNDVSTTFVPHVSSTLVATEPRKEQTLLDTEFVHIPSGEFIMGSQPADDPDASNDESPQHQVYVEGFDISRYPVTNAQYAAYARDKGVHVVVSKGALSHPVVGISWYEAQAYCRWASGQLGREVRLPSEEEWEKAARGVDGRIYPWGDEWNPGRANSIETERVETTPVDSFPKGVSPYGVADMSGNVWEWTASPYDKAKYQFDVLKRDRASPAESERPIAHRVIRGGSFGSSMRELRCANRGRHNPHSGSRNVGFRIAIGRRKH